MKGLGFALALALMGAGASAQQACFTREYSIEHLAKQPAQTVRAITVAFDGLATGEGTLGEWADVSVWFRGDGRRWTMGLWCPPGGASCAVECDGGVFSLRWKGSDTILLKTSGFIVGLGCDGEENASRVVADDGASSTTYRLNRAALDACPIGSLN